MRIRLLGGASALLIFGQAALFASMPAWAGPEGATSRAIGWFLQNKAPDGALPGYDNGYTVGGTADGILALVAAGEKPRRFGRKQGDTPAEYLEERAGDDTEENDPRDDAHLAGKVALAAALSGQDPHDLGGADLVRFMRDRYDPLTGGYRGGFKNSEVNPMGQALVVLGLIASEEAVPQKALDYLVTSQKPDGGWDAWGFGTDLTASSMAVQALVAAAEALGRTQAIDASVARSIPFFHGEQNDDGGFSNQKEFGGNFCSGTRVSEVDATGFAVQAIRALGQDPDGQAWVSPSGFGPKDYLSSMQNADGSFNFQDGPDCEGNGGSTYAAMLGLEEASFVCLLELGTCPPGTVFGQWGGPAADPLLEEGLRENNPAAPAEAASRPPPPQSRPGTATRPAKRPERQPAGRPLASTVPASEGSCAQAACPGASVSPAPVPPRSAMPARISPARSPSARLAAEERLSGSRKTDPVVWVLLALIGVLSISIGRQVLRSRN